MEAPEPRSPTGPLDVRRKKEATWRGNADVRAPWNRPVRLRIYLNDAWLYAFRFGYGDRAECGTT